MDVIFTGSLFTIYTYNSVKTLIIIHFHVIKNGMRWVETRLIASLRLPCLYIKLCLNFPPVREVFGPYCLYTDCTLTVHWLYNFSTAIIQLISSHSTVNIS